MTKRPKGKVGEFLGVFHEERLLQLGLAFLAAHSGAAFLKSLIDDLVMPLLFAMVGEGNWKGSAITLGNGAVLLWGPALSQAIHFAIVVLVIMGVFHHLKKFPSGKDER
jgi:large-conductance mechanosensitive channel